MTVGQAAEFAVFVFMTVVVVMDSAVAVRVSVVVETTYVQNVNTETYKPHSTTNLVRLIDCLCLDDSSCQSIHHFSIVDLWHSIDTSKQYRCSTNKR